jgi:hypothetical protein
MWTAYAETAGWDILLVRKIDGCQIGIQAKLRLNLSVFSQTLDEGAHSTTRPGPDYRAILVPYDCAGATTLAAYLGLTIIRVRKPRMTERIRRENVFVHPALPDGTQWGSGSENYWHDWAPSKRHELPEYVPDVAAGASAPLQLTKWKIAALKLVAILNTRGCVTRADFKALGIDHRRWTTPGYEWIISNGKPLQERVWTRGARLPDFEGQHPTVYADILAKHLESKK